MMKLTKAVAVVSAALMFFLAGCEGTKKEERSISSSRSEQIANELFDEVMSEHDSTFIRLSMLDSLMRDYAVESEYVEGTGNFIEPNSHYAYEHDYDMRRFLFLCCFDYDSLSSPHPGKRYTCEDFTNQYFNRIEPLYVYNSFKFLTREQGVEALKQNVEFYYSLYTDASLDSIRKKCKEEFILETSHVNDYDYIVFCYLDKYSRPKVDPTSTLEYLPSFSSGYMKTHIVVTDIRTASVVDRFTMENANCDSVSFFSPDIDSQGPRTGTSTNELQALARAIDENLFYTFQWRLKEMLSKRGIAPKRKSE